MNKEQQELLDEAYENYCKEYESGTHLIGTGLLWMSKETKDTFSYRSKTDNSFSERWGLKIGERELSLEERRVLAKYESQFISPITVESWDRNNIPTKLITITYNNKTIESYE